ncbi:uncharacterized protein LOC144115924 [Amblyomma americanum]
MPKDSSPTSAALPPTFVCAGALRQRDPAVFSGTGDHDVEDWLSSYERVSIHYKCDDARKLNNVIFYLTDFANLWYRNLEADITLWSAFKQNFAGVFGLPAVRKLRAEQRLRARAQLPGENFTSYIEDVVYLCRRVDSSMPERAKIDHILKGIDDNAFQMLLAKNPATVVDVLAQCQSYDELRKRHLLTRSPLSKSEPMGALTSDCDHSPLLPQIKEFIREEVARQLSLVNPSPDASSLLMPSLQRVIREQVAEALPTLPEVRSVPPLSYAEAAAHYNPSTPVAAPLTYAAVAAQPHPVAFSPSPPFLRPAPVPPAAPLHPPSSPHYNPWRTPDNRPICFSCGFPGHVARHCRRRMVAPPAFAPSAGLPQLLRAAPPPEAYASDQRPYRTRRSPSPRHRSLSPIRRRPTPAYEGN